MPLYVRYGNEPEAFTRTLARIVEGLAPAGQSVSRASTSLSTRMSSAGPTAPSRCSICSPWWDGTAIAG